MMETMNGATERVLQRGDAIDVCLLARGLRQNEAGLTTRNCMSETRCQTRERC